MSTVAAAKEFRTLCPVPLLSVMKGMHPRQTEVYFQIPSSRFRPSNAVSIVKVLSERW